MRRPAALLPLLLTGCVSAADVAMFGQECENHGLKPGSERHQACVEQLRAFKLYPDTAMLEIFIQAVEAGKAGEAREE